jgi:transcription antitermination factor NusG
MFPGYLFVRAALDKHRYIDLLKVQGVVRVLEDGWTRLTPVPDAEIDAIQQIAAAGVDVFPCAQLRAANVCACSRAARRHRRRVRSRPAVERAARGVGGHARPEHRGGNA